MAPTTVQFKDARTPTRSPIKTQRVAKGLTEIQKQAIIENLQLEITERARKLRAQYALQSQTMRSRLEIRINRIPVALRKLTIGELAAQHLAKKVTVASPAKSRVEDIREEARASPSPRPKKRTSDEISVDKENQNQDLEYPKKRARGPAPPVRTTSQEKIQPSQVLSPRSANSRSYQRPQARTALQSKPVLTRPASPLKPVAPAPSGSAAGILTNMVEKAKATRGAAARNATAAKKTETKKVETKQVVEAKLATGVGRGRRAAAPTPAPVASTTRATRGRARTISDSSDTSNGTVVRKPIAKKEPAKRTVMGTLRGMGTTAAKKAASAPKATAGTRVLRKRG